MTRQEFIDAVYSCAVGEKISYHRGQSCGTHLRGAAMELCENGAVALVTKKHGPFDFEYFAVRLSGNKRKGKSNG